MATSRGVDYSDKYVNGENLKELVKKLRNEIAATGGKDVYKQDVNIEENTDGLGTYHRISVTTTYKDGKTKTSRAVILPSATGGTTVTAITATISTSSWSSNTASVSVAGVTASNNILVSPSPNSTLDYSSAQIRCTEQVEGTLTFVCETVPTSDINLNILIFNS